jgi:hypothetical protein
LKCFIPLIIKLYDTCEVIIKLSISISTGTVDYRFYLESIVMGFGDPSSRGVGLRMTGHCVVQSGSGGGSRGEPPPLPPIDQKRHVILNEVKDLLDYSQFVLSKNVISSVSEESPSQNTIFM